jgi:hypothetical protein
MLDDTLKTRGRVVIEVNGIVVSDTPNLITTAGLTRLAALVAGTGATAPSHMAIGTGTTAPTISDTTLATEVDRNALVATTASANVVTYRAYWAKSDGNTNTIAEVGLFDAAAAGTLIARTILDSTVVKNATKALSISWTFTLS